MAKSYYEILDVGKNAGFDEIKSAFRRLAKRCHPDITAGTGTDFHKIKEAFDTLSDPARRRRYDKQIGFYKPMANSFRNHRVYVPPASRDIYDDLVDVITDRFHIPRRRTLEFELFLSNHELVNGTKTSITIPQEKICPRCFGFGGSLLHVCQSCQGGGLVDYDVVFDVILEPPLSPGQIYELNENGYLLRFQIRRGDFNG